MIYDYGNRIGSLLHLFSIYTRYLGDTFSLSLKEQSYACQCPFRGLVFGLQIERPHVSGPSSPRFVNGALVHVTQILFVLRDRPHVDHRHGGKQFLRLRIDDDARLHLPSCPFHEDPVDVRAVSGCSSKLSGKKEKKRGKKEKNTKGDQYLHCKCTGIQSHVRELFFVFLRHVALQTHFIERKFVSSRCRLHDSRE